MNKNLEIIKKRKNQLYNKNLTMKKKCKNCFGQKFGIENVKKKTSLTER